ncbi:RloB domain-containing protein [Acetobacteraceae bacterium]|nr:RloB domain-containing protein [Acetobacteraceae bacterium]
MAKEAWLIVVEGSAEQNFFTFLANDFSDSAFLPKHIALTIVKAGGGRSPAKRILERAKQEKRSKQKAPYRHIFALLDLDRAYKGMEEDFQAENIILMTCDPRLENVLLACDNHPISAHEDAKESFQNHFGTEAQHLNWWGNLLPCNLTKEKLLNCPLLESFWEKAPL